MKKRNSKKLRNGGIDAAVMLGISAAMYEGATKIVDHVISGDIREAEMRGELRALDSLWEYEFEIFNEAGGVEDADLCREPMMRIGELAELIAERRAKIKWGEKSDE